MVKGEPPFDAAAVNAAFTQWADTAAQLPKLSGQFENRRHPCAAEDLGGSRRLQRARRCVREGVGGAAEGCCGLKAAFPPSAKPAVIATRDIGPPRRSSDRLRNCVCSMTRRDGSRRRFASMLVCFAFTRDVRSPTGALDAPRSACVLILALLGAAGFWFVTRPAGHCRKRVAGLQANLENAKTCSRGGCASCHANSEAGGPHAPGGGNGAQVAYGAFYPPNISPDPKDGIGPGPRPISSPR